MHFPIENIKTNVTMKMRRKFISVGKIPTSISGE